MSRWLSEKLGDYIVNFEQLLMTISEGRMNLKHTISQRNAQAIQDLLVGIYFLVHSRTYTSVLVSSSNSDPHESTHDPTEGWCLF